MQAGQAGAGAIGGARRGNAAGRRGELTPPSLDLDEPGTIEFTAQRALAGRALNRFALSLRSPASRAEFLADEAGYVRRFGLTEEEARLVGERDWTGLLRAGGHLQAVLKLAATVGEDLWSIGAHNVGCDREALIAATPRRVSGVPAPRALAARRRSARLAGSPARAAPDMRTYVATVIGGIGISHTPSMGIEYDRGIASPDGFSPRWQPWYDGTRRVAELLERLAPDHLVVIYNDHLNHFDLDNYPTLAIGVGARFPQADEGWGPRDLPDLAGDTRWGLHLTEELVGARVRPDR